MCMKVRIATDCSGTDAPLYAIRQTSFYKRRSIIVKHQWSSDNNKAAQQFIAANHSPREFFPDLTVRDHYGLRKTNIYVAGFPCQPFSKAGLKRGFRDRRTKVYKGVVDTLRAGRIRAFLLENVEGLIRHNAGKTLQKVLSDLEGANFHVDYRVYKSSEFGLPTNRPRVYFMGIHRDVGKRPFLPNAPGIEPPPLSTCLDPEKGPLDAMPSDSRDSNASRNLRRALKVIRRSGDDPMRQCWALDIDS